MVAKQHQSHAGKAITKSALTRLSKRQFDVGQARCTSDQSLPMGWKLVETGFSMAHVVEDDDGSSWPLTRSVEPPDGAVHL